MEIKYSPLNLKYLDDYLKYVNSEEVGVFTDPGKTEAFSKEKIVEWLSRSPKVSERVDWLIIDEAKDKFIGEVVLNNYNGQSANIRIGIVPEYWERGIGTKALKDMIQYAFDELDMKKINLGVYEINQRGIHVYKKLGFVETKRRYCDNYVEIEMELLKEQFINK